MGWMCGTDPCPEAITSETAIPHEKSLPRTVPAALGRAPAGFTAVRQWLDHLARRGELEAYLDAAAAADVAIFPSRVREAGPLVFLEAMAAGVFPLGTYFGGMAASIDATAATLPADAVDRMKLRTPDAEGGGIIADIAEAAVATLESAGELGPLLRDHVERRHDWRAVAGRLRDTLVPEPEE